MIDGPFHRLSNIIKTWRQDRQMEARVKAHQETRRKIRNISILLQSGRNYSGVDGEVDRCNAARQIAAMGKEAVGTFLPDLCIILANFDPTRHNSDILPYVLTAMRRSPEIAMGAIRYVAPLCDVRLDDKDQQTYIRAAAIRTSQVLIEEILEKNLTDLMEDADNALPFMLKTYHQPLSIKAGLEAYGAIGKLAIEHDRQPLCESFLTMDPYLEGFEDEKYPTSINHAAGMVRVTLDKAKEGRRSLGLPPARSGLVLDTHEI